MERVVSKSLSNNVKQRNIKSAPFNLKEEYEA